MHAWKRLILLLYIVIAVAGCGGSSDGGAPETVTADTNSGAYQGGLDVCSKTPVEQHALELDVEPTPEAIADAIGFAIAGKRSGADYENGRQGCLYAYANE